MHHVSCIDIQNTSILTGFPKLWRSAPSLDHLEHHRLAVNDVLAVTNLCIYTNGLLGTLLDTLETPQRLARDLVMDWTRLDMLTDGYAEKL
jgi:hypothetical protein